MKIQCDITAPCPDDANPIQNLSSEAPDVNHFFAYGSGPGSVLPGRGSGPGGVGPNPGGNFSAECETENGPITCVAETQEEADLCVARMGQQCTEVPGTPPGTPRTPSGDPLYSNALQVCAALCPDGSPFIFQVAAGQFVATSQILADREARTYACRQAELLKICMGALSNSAACVGQSYSGTVTVSGTGVNTFSIVSGSLPPGVTLISTPSTALFAGVPTVPGNYTFSLRAVNTRGNSMVKSFTIFTLGFTNGAPTDFTVGSPYSFQFTGSGGTGTYTFIHFGGLLPTGLTISSDGLLSGTPTEDASFNFDVQMTDGAGRTCFKSFTASPANVAKVGWRVCWWSTVRADIEPQWALIGSVPSALPAWDGIFEFTVDDGFGGKYIYFTGQSISGFQVSADESGPDYPNGDFSNTQCFTSLYWDGIGPWRIFIQNVGCVSAWNGTGTSFDPDDPSGIYTRSAGNPTPARISIAHTNNCCDNVDVTPVPATVTLAQGFTQPTRLRIVNMAGVVSEMCPCTSCQVATTQPAWDGSFPTQFVNPGTLLAWSYTTGAFTGGYTPLSLDGRLLQDFSITAFNLASVFVIYDVSGPKWSIFIRCIDAANALVQLWIGAKTVGNTPVGNYTLVGASVSTAPACIELESY